MIDDGGAGGGDKYLGKLELQVIINFGANGSHGWHCRRHVKVL